MIRRLFPTSVIVITIALLAVAVALASSNSSPYSPQGDAPPAPLATLAAGSGIVSYQGRLADASGQPISDTATITVRLYDALTGGNLVWSETHANAPVRDGIFTLQLGSITPLYPSSFAVDRWLEVSVNGGEPLAPRRPVSAAPIALTASQVPWAGITGMPEGFADGIDNVATIISDTTTIYTGVGLGQITGTAGITLYVNFAGSGDSPAVAHSDHDHAGVYAAFTHTHPGSDITSPVSEALTATRALSADDADTLDGQHGAYYLDWNHLANIPPGFADGVDNDTLYTYTAGFGLALSDTQFSVMTGTVQKRVADECAAGSSIRAIDANGVVTCEVDDAGAGGDITSVYAGPGLSGGGESGAITLTVLFSGTGSADAAARSDHNHDSRYVNEGQPDSITSAMIVNGAVSSSDLQDGATLAEILDDDGAGSGLDADLLDGQHGGYYRNASNINAGALDPAYYSAYSDLGAEGYLDNSADADLPTRLQADGRYVNEGQADSITSGMIVNGTVSSSDLQDGATLAEILDDDGAGSGLDADLLDGQHASAFAPVSHAHDHGALTGLGDDDHPQYFNLSQNETVAGIPAFNGGASGSSAPFSVDSNYLVANLNADLLDGQHGAYYQARVAGTCAAGSAIRVINADGTVTCQSISSISGACPFGSTLRAINADGSFVCQADAPHNRNTLPGPNSLIALGTMDTQNSPMAVSVGTDGLPIMAYSNNSRQLTVRHCDAPDCTSSTATVVDPTNGMWYGGASLAIGSDGLALIAYQDFLGKLRAYHCSNATCTAGSLYQIDTMGNAPSIAIGADGLGMISYSDSSGYLRVAHCSNVNCSTAAITVIDNTGVVEEGETSIALGADGLMLIAYSTVPEAMELRTAHCANVACSSSTRATIVSSEMVSYASLVIGQDGLGLIAYAGGGSGALKVAHCNNAACSSVTTVNSGLAATATRITLGSDYLGVISFYQPSATDLWVAHCADTKCTTLTAVAVDAAQEAVGINNALTVGVDGLPVVAYKNFTDGTIKLAHCSNVFCTPYFRRR